MIIQTRSTGQDMAAHVPEHSSEAKQAKLNLGTRRDVCPTAGEK